MAAGGASGASFTSTSNDYSQAAYDLLARYALRPELYYDAIADVKPTRQSMPGKTVTFTIQNDIAINKTALTEGTDVTPVAATDSQVVVTLAEYGAAVVSTALARGTSFIDIDPIIANIVGYNAGVSIDSVAADVITTNVASGQTWYGNVAPPAAPTQGSSKSALTATNTLHAADFRTMYVQLKVQNVPTLDGGAYVAMIDPATAYDLRSETTNNAWVTPHQYQDATPIYNGEIGQFEGFRVIVTPRAPYFATSGASSTNVYGSLFMGRQALAKAWSMTDGNSDQPHVVPGPVTDNLRRFVPIGWYHLVGYSLYRAVALLMLLSESSLGATVTRPTIDQP